jgi:hypothetical protein
MGASTAGPGVALAQNSLLRFTQFTHVCPPIKVKQFFVYLCVCMCVYLYKYIHIPTHACIYTQIQLHIHVIKQIQSYTYKSGI